jgi:hypothetical protein
MERDLFATSKKELVCYAGRKIANEVKLKSQTSWWLNNKRNLGPPKRERESGGVERVATLSIKIDYLQTHTGALHGPLIMCLRRCLGTMRLAATLCVWMCSAPICMHTQKQWRGICAAECIFGSWVRAPTVWVLTQFFINKNSTRTAKRLSSIHWPFAFTFAFGETWKNIKTA